jgi:hypothetical protein
VIAAGVAESLFTYKTKIHRNPLHVTALPSDARDASNNARSVSAAAPGPCSDARHSPKHFSSRSGGESASTRCGRGGRPRPQEGVEVLPVLRLARFLVYGRESPDDEWNATRR